MGNSATAVVRVNRDQPERAAIMEAVKVLRTGGLIILPTETVYGLAADPHVDGAEERLIAAKDRDRGKPIPLLAAGLTDVERHGAVLSPAARRLAMRYWPGPLTLVLSCGGRTEGFRVPAHPVALAVVKAAGGILRVTSANKSGEPATKTVEEALATLGSIPALALDTGPSSLGVESTVVDATGASFKILRQGALSKAAVLSRPKVLFVCTGNTCRSPMAEVLLRRWLGKDSEWEVESAGVSAMDGQRASDGAITVLSEQDLDLSAHRSRPLIQAHVDDADLVVVMTSGHKRAVLQRFPRAEGKVVLLNAFNPRHPGEDVPDPFGMDWDVYRTIRDEINAALPDLVLYLHGLYQHGNDPGKD